MATWRELSEDSEMAAQLLHDQGRCRSSANRAYYSAYALIASKVAVDGRAFSHGRKNPSHSAMLDLLDEIGARAGWDRRGKSECRRYFRNLLNGRIDADYRPGRTVEHSDSLDSLRNLNSLKRKLEKSK